ncbi:tail fiber protein [Leptospira borgpetersenii serovar Balcanica]|nr:tail fiber protein [Leptospira borgpetersenii serovar Balcanica]
MTALGVRADNLNQLDPNYFKDANGQAISRSQFAALWNLVHRTVTGITPSTDRVNVAAHGRIEGDLIKFSFSGGGITAFTKYYVRNPTLNDFQISSTKTGSIIDLTANQTGDCMVDTEFGFGDGSTTFTVQDRNGIFVRGAGVHGTRAKAAGGNYDGGPPGYEGQDMFQPHGHELWGEIGSAPGTGTVHFNTNSANITRLFAGGGPTGQPVRTPTSDGVNGTPRVGNETVSANVAARMKVRVA